MRLSRARLGATAVVLSLLVADQARGQDDGLPSSSIPAPTRRYATTAKPSIPATITTRFDVAKDGLPFINYGDFGGPGGNCLGMSLIAIDNFQRRLAAERAGKPDAPPPPMTDQPETVDVAKQETVSLAQAIASTRDVERAHSPAVVTPLSNPANIRAALARMARTGQPQVMLMTAGNEGHANVLYGYKDGKLQLYDPNYPGETVEWPFDPVTGLGTHPKAGLNGDGTPNFYSQLDSAGANSFSRYRAATALAHVRSVCAAGGAECVARYPTVDATAASDGAGRVTVSGTVSGGPAMTDGTPTIPPSAVWVAVNGNPVGLASLNPNGTFTLTLDASAFQPGTNDLRVVATSDNPNAGPQFAGYVDKNVAPIPTTKGLVGVLGGATGTTPAGP
jgi:hypothetical protein